MSNLFTFNIRVHTWSPHYTLLTKYTSQFRGLPHRVEFRVGVPASVSSNQSSANSRRPLLLAELDVHSATPHDIGGVRGGEAVGWPSISLSSVFKWTLPLVSWCQVRRVSVGSKRIHPLHRRRTITFWRTPTVLSPVISPSLSTPIRFN